MQLRDRGVLDIDRPLVEYLPGLSLAASARELRGITSRTLMTHHSGLPGDWYDGYWSDEPGSFRNVLEHLKGCSLPFSPGTVFSYSNLGTSLLGVLIEAMGRLPSQEYVERKILAALEMNDSAARTDGRPRLHVCKAYSRGELVEDPTLRPERSRRPSTTWPSSSR